MSQVVETYVQFSVPSDGTGSQIISFGPGSPFWSCDADPGLDPAEIYSLTVRVDGFTQVVYVHGEGSPVLMSTFEEITQQIDNQLIRATAVCSSTLGSPMVEGILITSLSTGAASSVLITDGGSGGTDLLSSIVFDSTILDPATVEETTYLFTHATEQIRFDAIPILNSVRITPAKIQPGVSIGQRESLGVSFMDCLYKFDDDNFEDGTFWTKLRARFSSFQGTEITIYQGTTDDVLLEDMDSRLYIIDELQISDNKAAIKAKDPLMLLNGDQAQAPEVSTGRLQQDISSGEDTITLLPIGVVGQYYQPDGKVCIGGTEICSFDRFAGGTPYDHNATIRLTTRGENIDAKTHNEDEKVQQCLVYDAETPSTIIYDLLVTYARIKPEWITLSDWVEEVDDYIGRSFSAIIPESTAVKKLLDELCEQVGLVIWWDSLAKQIRLKPLRPVSVPPAITFGDDIIIKDSFVATEQPNRRVSQVWTYYGMSDPVKKVSEKRNYGRIAVQIANNTANYSQQKIKKIYSRWIPSIASSTADRLNELIVARFKVPPRLFNFDLFRSPGQLLPKLGEGVDLQHWTLVDSLGIEVSSQAQITSRKQDDDRSFYQAEEMNFDAPDSIGGSPEGQVRYVYIDGDAFDANLRDYYDSVYSALEETSYIYFVVSSGAVIGATDTSIPAMQVGDWSDGVNVSLYLINNGVISGRGGDGSNSWNVGAPTPDGLPGGTGFYTRTTISVTNNNIIQGGGGGGGHFYNTNARKNYNFGGGGAGAEGGNGGFSISASRPSWSDGSLFYGGAGSAGESGGQPYAAGASGGLPGAIGSGYDGWGQGGSGGDAVDGHSYITYETEGTITGDQVN